MTARLASLRAEAFAAARAVNDPEIPVTLLDLGVLRRVEVDADVVHVWLHPTRSACPGLARMESDLRSAICGAVGDRICGVEVHFEVGSWRSQDVTAEGRAALRDLGFVVGELVQCPYCGSGDLREDGLFGGSVCKRPYTCRDCGSTFDKIRSAVEQLMSANPVPVSLSRTHHSVGSQESATCAK